jgi:hypothetical protein
MRLPCPKLLSIRALSRTLSVRRAVDPEKKNLIAKELDSPQELSELQGRIPAISAKVAPLPENFRPIE